MRLNSALQILDALRQAPDEPMSIREICRRIRLSYEPTYNHVRALEAEGVIRTWKIGRQVACRLARGPAAAIWLGLLSLQKAGALVRSTADLPGLLDALASEQDEPVAPIRCVLWQGAASAGTRPRLTLVAASAEGLVERIPPQQSGRVQWRCYDEVSFAAELSQPERRRELAAISVPLTGHQWFWDQLLAHLDTLEAAPAAPTSARRARRARAPRPAAEIPTPQPAALLPRDEEQFID